MSKPFHPNLASVYAAEWEEATLMKSTTMSTLYLQYLGELLIILKHSIHEVCIIFELLNPQYDI